MSFMAAVILLSAAVPMSFATERKVQERITVEGEGEAGILGEDLSGARKTALGKAFKNAFENALDQILPLGLPPEAGPDIFNELAGKRKKFLLGYRILSEMPAMEEFFITIEATFSGPMILHELAAKGIGRENKESADFIKINVHFTGVTVFEWYQRLMYLFQQELEYVKTASLVEALDSSMVLHVEYEGDFLDFMNTVADLRFKEFVLELREGKNDISSDDDKRDEAKNRDHKGEKAKEDDIKKDDKKDDKKIDYEIERDKNKGYNVSVSILPVDNWRE